VKSVRVIPVIIAAASLLFVMKGIGIVTQGHFVLAGTTAAVASGGGHDEPAHEPAPDTSHGPPPGALENAKPLAERRPVGEPIKIEDLPPDVEVLEKLTERRQELEKRSDDLDQREALLQAAEKRVEARIGELKQLEASIDTKVAQNDAEKAKELKTLVATYEAMKGKDAARILDKLDLTILIGIAKQIKPAKMAEILAAMAPDSAEKLTIALAGSGDDAPAADKAKTLPKIGEIPEKPVNAR
jgi:flagellar motility protein MotE (MotC chaperone)